MEQPSLKISREEKPEKPTASLSLDLDNKWCYLKTYGDPGWNSFPSYLDILIPRVLQFFQDRHLTLTFFVVGQDAALETNHGLLRAIADAGHEIGNHSFRHEPWLHLYSDDEIKAELDLAEEHIERATGHKPVGFRGPGYSLSVSLLRELMRRDYQYDASCFPNILESLARAYYLRRAKFSAEERAKRKLLGGTLRNAFRPIKPYRWQLDRKSIIELPVTTLPGVRIPIHISYILCLNTLSPSLALQYFTAALRFCRLTGTQPSLLLHPTDFLGHDDEPDLAFFPAMKLSGKTKLEFVGQLIQKLLDEFTVVTLQNHAHLAANWPKLSVARPRFPQMAPSQPAGVNE